MKSLHTKSFKYIIKILLDTIATELFLMQEVSGAFRENSRLPMAGSPTLTGERLHLNFCIRFELSSTRLLMSIHLYCIWCYSNPMSKTLKGPAFLVFSSHLLFWFLNCQLNTFCTEDDGSLSLSAACSFDILRVYITNFNSSSIHAIKEKRV